MFDLITFNPADVILDIVGYSCSGWNEIKIERKVKPFKMVHGIRGKNTRTKNRDTSATVTISLLQVSPTNDVLSRIVQEDELKGTGRIELLLKDNSGNSVFKSSEAYLNGQPIVTYRDSVEYNQWTFECLSTDVYFAGGNAKPNNAFLDLLSNI